MQRRTDEVQPSRGCIRDAYNPRPEPQGQNSPERGRGRGCLKVETDLCPACALCVVLPILASKEYLTGEAKYSTSPGLFLWYYRFWVLRQQKRAHCHVTVFIWYKHKSVPGPLKSFRSRPRIGDET